MMYCARLTVLTLFIAVLPLIANAVNHPASAYLPIDGSPSYESTGAPVGWNSNDIYFLNNADKPDWTELTDMEKYMVAGVAGEGDRIELPAWSTSIFSMVCHIHERNGYIPQQLCSELVWNRVGMEHVANPRLDVFRNPLTGEWPKLNAETHSPGDLYIRQLTEAEMQYYADLNPAWQKLWFEGESVDKIYYVRIYGWDEAIFTSLMFQAN